MRRALHLVAALAASAGLGLGCATFVDVEVEEGEDLSSYRSWDWLPQAPPAVDAPAGHPAGIDAELAQLIERGLREHGYRRAGARSDFFVTSRLMVRQREVEVQVPAAMYVLSSFHSSPSYWIERTISERRVYEDSQLAIGATDRRGRWIWRGWLTRRDARDAAGSLEDDVTTLMRRFPVRDRSADAPTTPRVAAGTRSPPAR